VFSFGWVRWIPGDVRCFRRLFRTASPRTPSGGPGASRPYWGGRGGLGHAGPWRGGNSTRWVFSSSRRQIIVIAIKTAEPSVVLLLWCFIVFSFVSRPRFGGAEGLAGFDGSPEADDVHNCGDSLGQLRRDHRPLAPVPLVPAPAGPRGFW
jgi:hypothetical protein